MYSPSYRAPLSARAAEQPKRGSEHLSVDFWGALRLDFADNAAMLGHVAPDRPKVVEQRLKHTPEMKEVGPPSPFLPMLGRQSQVGTPHTAIHQQVASPALNPDEYFQAALRDIERSVLTIQPVNNQRGSSSLPPSPMNSTQAWVEQTSRLTLHGQMQSPAAMFFGAPQSPIFGAPQSPTLPWLSTAPIVPSWRQRAEPAPEAPPPEVAPVVEHRSNRISMNCYGKNSRQPSTPSLLTTLFEATGWSENNTPITPIEVDDADEMFALNMECSFLPEPTRRSNPGPSSSVRNSSERRLSIKPITPVYSQHVEPESPINNAEVRAAFKHVEPQSPINNPEVRNAFRNVESRNSTKVVDFDTTPTEAKSSYHNVELQAPPKNVEIISPLHRVDLVRSTSRSVGLKSPPYKHVELIRSPRHVELMKSPKTTEHLTRSPSLRSSLSHFGLRSPFKIGELRSPFKNVELRSPFKTTESPMTTPRLPVAENPHVFWI